MVTRAYCKPYEDSVYPSSDKAFDKTTMLACCITDEKINRKRRPTSARKHCQRQSALAEVVPQKAALRVRKWIK